MQLLFFRLYGRRNRLFLRDLAARIALVNLAVADLQDAIRKDVGVPKLMIAVARVGSRVFCVAQHFGDLGLEEAFAAKYLADACTYCQQAPCICGDTRPACSLAETTVTERADWSMARCQQHLNRLYGKANRQKGIEYVLLRLYKEVSELLEVQLRIETWTGSHHDIMLELALELSDILAWTHAVANVLSIDLEEVLLARYGNGCWKCKATPCECGPFSFRQVDWKQVGEDIQSGR